MKTRAEAVAFIGQQLDWRREPHKSKAGAHHYGRQDLRDLLDFIFEGEPQSDAERLPSPSKDSWKRKD